METVEVKELYDCKYEFRIKEKFEALDRVLKKHGYHSAAEHVRCAQQTFAYEVSNKLIGRP